MRPQITLFWASMYYPPLFSSWILLSVCESLGLRIWLQRCGQHLAVYWDGHRVWTGLLMATKDMEKSKPILPMSPQKTQHLKDDNLEHHHTRNPWKSVCQDGRITNGSVNSWSPSLKTLIYTDMWCRHLHVHTTLSPAIIIDKSWLKYYFPLLSCIIFLIHLRSQLWHLLPVFLTS